MIGKEAGVQSMQGLTDQDEERGLLQGQTEELHLRLQDLLVSVPL